MHHGLPRASNYRHLLWGGAYAYTRTGSDVLVAAVLNASAGRHAKTGDWGEDADLGFSQPFPAGQADEGEFDFSRPFLVDIGRAAVIAEYLRESGYRAVPQTW